MKPIIFSGEMVRAILAGRKTQTRRVVKLDGFGGDPVYETADGEFHDTAELCPYGQPAGRLWVRETFKTIGVYSDRRQVLIEYKAGGRSYAEHVPDWCRYYDRANNGRWSASIHMPKWASRLTLEVTGVAVARLQDISEEDAYLEGVKPYVAKGIGGQMVGADVSHRHSFIELWDSINKSRGYGWDTNPWVWVVEFKRIAPEDDN